MNEARRADPQKKDDQKRVLVLISDEIEDAELSSRYCFVEMGEEIESGRLWGMATAAA